MLKIITDMQNGYFNIHVEFASDELIAGESLSGDTQIKGSEAQANDYAEVFSADLRRAYPKKFPRPEYPTTEMFPDIEGGNV